jgi:hypothetical protein
MNLCSEKSHDAKKLFEIGAYYGAQTAVSAKACCGALRRYVPTRFGRRFLASTVVVFKSTSRDVRTCVPIHPRFTAYQLGFVSLRH